MTWQPRRNEDIKLSQRWTLYESADDIEYLPDSALLEGSHMVDDLIKRLKELEAIAGSLSLRTTLEEDLKRLGETSLPKTVVALYGSTGSGKTSTANALLDRMTFDSHIFLHDTDTPTEVLLHTSGMQACTAAVTEISYHEHDYIEGTITFVSLDQWLTEIRSVLDRVDDVTPDNAEEILRNDASWEKVRLAYPELTASDVVNMTDEDILYSTSSVYELLGTIRTFTAPSADAFAQRLGQYDGYLGPSLDFAQLKYEAPDEDMLLSTTHPVLWPLIEKISIKCNAEVLSTGIVFVDLPGVGDSNAARNNIAKEYIGKAGEVWVFVPEGRAPDDKMAKDLLGEAFRLQLQNGTCEENKLAFIVTKTDIISENELVKELKVRRPHFARDPNFIKLESSLQNIRQETTQLKAKNKEANSLIEGMQREIRAIEVSIDEYRGSPDPESSRARQASNSEGPAKRARHSRTTGSSNAAKSTSKALLSVLEEARKIADPEKRKEFLQKNSFLASMDYGADANRLLVLKEKETNAKKAINAYCVLKRAEITRQRLKSEVLQTFLTYSDDDVMGDGGQSQVQVLSNIDLPVFSCSSHDYLRLEGLDIIEGETGCFSDVDDTGIPALRNWCHRRTWPARDRVAGNFLADLEAVARRIQQYTTQTSYASAERSNLEQLWMQRERTECEATSFVDPRNIRRSKAKNDALTIHDDMAAGMHWATYRATLRHHGVFKRDFNNDLVNPMIKTIAEPWAHVFRGTLIAHTIRMSAIDAVDQLLARIKTSASFRDFLERNRSAMFDSAAKSLTTRLDNLADLVGTNIASALESLAAQVEANVGGLWKTTPPESSTHKAIREKARRTAAEVLGQVILWQAARSMNAAEAEAEDSE
ncbi:hypothetical protein OF83DRAFT_1293359 [Amylostereum chailletii]|nr:hypothetical protein OF83DRAFT_1293359 [Amylostereum chailletii]